MLDEALAYGHLSSADVITTKFPNDLPKWLSRDERGESIFSSLVYKAWETDLIHSVKLLVNHRGAHIYGPLDTPLFMIYFMDALSSNQLDRTRSAALLSTLLDLEMFSTKINSARCCGMLPIHLLAQNGHVEAMEKLLERQVDVDAKTDTGPERNYQGGTALDIAVKHLHDEKFPPTVRAGGRMEIKRTKPLQDDPSSGNPRAKRMFEAHLKSWRLPPEWCLVEGQGIVCVDFFINLTTGEMANQKPALYCGENNGGILYNGKSRAKATTRLNDRKDRLRGITVTLKLHDATIDGFVYDNKYLALTKFDSLETLEEFDHTLDGISLSQIAISKVISRAVLDFNLVPGYRAFVEKSADVARKSQDGLPPQAEVILEEMLHDGSINSEDIEDLKRVINLPNMIDTKCEFQSLAPFSIKNDNLTRPLLNADNLTGLLIAADPRYLEYVEEFRADCSDVVRKVLLDYTPLHDAVLFNQLDTARILIAYNVRVDKPLPTLELTPLHMSVIGGSIEMAELLLNHGADPNAEDRDGFSPLQYCSCDFPELAELLIQNGASPIETISEGMGPSSASVEKLRKILRGSWDEE
ncbi:hypothetical protein F5Y11DRAFT_284386 [Daldinia sp. FL1419]|nr:hypothetical protein F5Y11DRAFT_284386 [Daldinia sp. FL1419]